VSFLLTALITAAISFSTAAVGEAYTKGETLDYTVTWMKVTGGTARMTIAPDDPERYRITSVVKSSGSLSRFFKVRDEIVSTVSTDDFSTLRYVKQLDERGDKMEEVTTVEDGVATRKRKKVRKFPVPRPVLDPISVIYYFRTLELAPGKSYELTLLSDGKIYTVHARVVKRETLTTPAGTFNTLMVEPQMVSAGVTREERLFIWYSDDERHLPVRIRTEVKFGSVTATLKGFSPGASAIDPAPLPR
jgi:hypothetical protein